MNYQVLTPNEFLSDVLFEAERATTRVWTQAMYFESGTITKLLFEGLKKAAQNGLDTRVHIDWFSLKYSNGKYLIPRSHSFFTKKQYFDQLVEHGIVLYYVNPPTLLQHFFPYSGRNHIKLTIIDNAIAYIGGVNFADTDFTFSDFMVKVTDPAIVSELAAIFEQIEKQQLIDNTLTIDENTKIIVDCGKPNRSPILIEAVKAVSLARVSVLHTGQFVPDGKFLRALIEAGQRHAQISIIAPSKNSFTPIFSFVYRLNRWLLFLQSNRLQITYKKTMVHAKLTIIDNSTVIIGSHNLSGRGVRVGTGEIALLSRNPVLVQNLRVYFEKLQSLNQMTAAKPT